MSESSCVAAIMSSGLSAPSWSVLNIAWSFAFKLSITAMSPSICPQAIC